MLSFFLLQSGGLSYACTAKTCGEVSAEASVCSFLGCLVGQSRQDLVTDVLIELEIMSENDEQSYERTRVVE